jgi:hypothetical protein
MSINTKVLVLFAYHILTITSVNGYRLCHCSDYHDEIECGHAGGSDCFWDASTKECGFGQPNCGLLTEVECTAPSCVWNPSGAGSCSNVLFLSFNLSSKIIVVMSKETQFNVPYMVALQQIHQQTQQLPALRFLVRAALHSTNRSALQASQTFMATQISNAIGAPHILRTHQHVRLYRYVQTFL